MHAAIRLLALVLLAATFAVTSPKSIGSSSYGMAAERPSGSPIIQNLEPRTATPWSYVVITGGGLMNSDGTCSVQISGVDSYVADCSVSEIRAVVPWTATSGNAVVSADGAASDPVQMTVTPLHLDSSDIVAGAINFKLAAGSEIASVLVRQGDPPLAIPAGPPGDLYMADWYALQVSPGSEVSKATSYESDPDVLYAGPIPAPKPADVPNDSHYPTQWALPKIDAPTAWNYSKGDGAKIAVIDSGFETSHPDLSGHMTSGWNCNGGSDVSALSNHGTRVAGVSAAVTNNGQGIAGVAWNSLIQPLRFDSAAGGSCPLTPVIEGSLIDKAVAEGAHVINMSYSYDFPQPNLCEKLREAWDAGLVLVAAAGNGNSSTPRDPAACTRVLGVGATNPDDSKAGYSNFGSWVDVTALAALGRRRQSLAQATPAPSYI